MPYKGYLRDFYPEAQERLDRGEPIPLGTEVQTLGVGFRGRVVNNDDCYYTINVEEHHPDHFRPTIFSSGDEVVTAAEYEVKAAKDAVSDATWKLQCAAERTARAQEEYADARESLRQANKALRETEAKHA